MSHEHKHGPNCNHSHGHNHNHTPTPNFNKHHKHGTNCKHSHDHKHGSHHDPKNNQNCNHNCKHNNKFKELTTKDYEKRRKRRKMRQWARRGNHTLQNCIAAIWIWTLSESSLRYYYENNMFDKIFLFHGLQILSLCLFFWSSLSEPGFLSSNAFPNETDKNLKKNEDEIESLLSPTLGYKDIDIEANASVIKIDPNNDDNPPSFCRNCKFLRPMRAKHCYMCDRCVPRFDHHCPLIEQCVGAKNYRQFYILCWSQLFVSGWSLMIAIDCLFYTDAPERSYIGWIWRILLFLWMLFQAFMATSLCSFHTYLVCTQQTTYEFLKPKKLKERLSFEQQNASTMSVDILGDIKPKSVKRKKGIPGPWVLMRKMCVGMGFCMCEYPFSQGFIRNWYGFVTAKCLERPEYFQTKPVILINSPPKDTHTKKESTEVAIDSTET